VFKRLGLYEYNIRKLFDQSVTELGTSAENETLQALSGTVNGEGVSPADCPFMLGGLSARPVETLLIYRRVNAGKFCACMTLLSYLLSVKWRKYEYTKQGRRLTFTVGYSKIKQGVQL